MKSIDDIRKKVSEYLPKADEDFIIQVYTMMLHEERGGFTEDEILLLKERRANYQSGKSQSYTREEAKKKLRDSLDS
jgi:hypothetical protein